MKNVARLIILVIVFSAGVLISRYGMCLECVAKHDANVGSDDYIFATQILQVQAELCSQDDEGRYIVKIDGKINIKGTQFNLLSDISDLLLKSAGEEKAIIKCTSPAVKPLLLKGSNIRIQNLEFIDCEGISVKGSDIEIENNKISNCYADCLLIGANSSDIIVKGNIFKNCSHYGMNIKSTSLTSDETSLKQLFCLNKIIDTEHKTNILNKIGDSGEDDYEELNLKDQTTNSSICDKFVCGEGGTIGSDGKCVCADGYAEAPPASGICKKCEAGETLDLATGACKSPCSDPFASVNADGTCGDCKEVNGIKYARYMGLGPNEADCKACGSPCKFLADDNKCISLKDDHIVDINGVCKPYSADSCGDPNADRNENGVCECKTPCFERVGDPNGTAWCRSIPECDPPTLDCSLPVNQLAVDCNCAFEDNAGAPHCLAGQGDCSCRLYSRPVSNLQTALPLLFALLGLGGLVAWRRNS